MQDDDKDEDEVVSSGNPEEDFLNLTFSKPRIFWQTAELLTFASVKRKKVQKTRDINKQELILRFFTNMIVLARVII